MENEWNLRMMSPQQILNQKLTEPSMLGYGLKKRLPDETSDEIVSRLQDDLQKLISYERVEKSVSRSQAEYHAMTGLVVVTRKLGKWNTIGYRTDNLDCLTYYETLYLMDTNRLELYYDSVLVSLEQAYALLLNNQRDAKSQEKYFVYSILSKAGYIVQPHRQHVQVSQGHSIQPNWTKDITPSDQCVWRCLFEDLNRPTSSRDISHEDDDLYRTVKQKMTQSADAIKSQHTTQAIDHRLNDGADNWQNAIVKAKARKDSSRKRKMEPSTSKKSSKLECSSDRFLDVLTYEQDVCNFKKIFEEIQIIQLDGTHCDDSTDSTNSDFDFDLFSARHSFKQSDPGLPDFRIIIFKSNREPPTRELIVKAFLRPVVPAPVLVFYINELMRVSAFLYRITL